jgi:tryptophan-rich sensory protein
LWGAQLGLNAAWSPTFFAAKRPGTALGIITALLPTLGRYVKYAREVDRLAARLMVPYLAWTGFATYLNGAIVSKNAGKIGSS